jgi:pilus assembly protein FimV
MSLRYVMRVLVLAGFMPAGAFALGLGDIHLKSALNAPLDANIDVSATAEELAGLKVTLASRESFARYGLDYPSYLASVTLQAGKAADGHDVIQVRSRDVVTEPFATLLVEANWARGRLVREYTVLLDPPVFTSENASAAAAVAAPASAPQNRAGTVARPATATPEAAGTARQAAAAPAPGATASEGTNAGAGGSYVVKRGDTLSGVAARTYANDQRERALVALYRGNAAAFDGNMNVLRAGATLQLPDSATLAAIGPADAAAEVSAQYRAWVPGHTGGQLKLVAPTQAGAPGGNASAGAAETAALQQRVTQLQADLNESKRLLELRNAELARLQERIGKTGQAAAPVSAPPVAPPAAVVVPPPAPVKESAKPEPAPVAQQQPAAAAAPAEVPPIAPGTTPKPRHQVPEAAVAGDSMFDWLLENWYVPAGAIGALLAGLLGWRLVRSRQSQAFDRSLDRLATPSPEPTARPLRPAETQPMRSLQPSDESSFVVEESGTHQAPVISDRDFAAMQGASISVDDTVSGDTAMALDQGDPLAEADFHMAYGLYDQAADLVRIAISREPQRRDLKLKLLEVFFVWGNKDQFLTLARELSTSRDRALAGEWEKVVIMGRQIAPDDALFSSGGALPGAVSGGVDLNLEGGQNRVDFDLLGEPNIAPEHHGDGIDLDLGAALPAADASGDMRSLGDTGVDFMLDDPARGSDATGSTREMPQSQTVTLDTINAAEAPTIEQLRPGGADSPTIRQKLDMSVRQGFAGADPTTELAIDDLGLDVTGGDTGIHVEEDGGSSPTMLTSLDDDTRRLFARAQANPGDTAEMPAPSGGASGTWLFTDKDFSSVLPAIDERVPSLEDTRNDLATAVMPSPLHDSDDTGLGLTSQIKALKSAGGGVDLDLDGLEATGAPGSTGVDLDVGASRAAPDSRFTETQRLAPEAAIVDGEPATMSEVGTKLDLARAYMDMGDPEGARSILEEVLAEGSASQKTEARRLIDSLPG